jgi:hypothetical protein
MVGRTTEERICGDPKRRVDRKKNEREEGKNITHTSFV